MKRCPNGSTRNKKTGLCEKKRTLKNKSPSPTALVETAIVSAITPQKTTELPSIITILIFAHGADLIDVDYADAQVRIISSAGNAGALAIDGPSAVDIMQDLYADQSKEYHKMLQSKNVKQKNAESIYPNATTCKIAPKLFFDKESNTFLPQSTYRFLQKMINTGDLVEEYKRMAVYKMNKNPEMLSPFTTKATLNAIEENANYKIYTPVVNKVYNFSDEETRKNAAKQLANRKQTSTIVRRQTVDEAFGIYVLDTCNYEGPVKPDDDMTKTKKAYNKAFLTELNGKKSFIGKTRPYDLTGGYITMSYIANYLHELGFDVVNMIDLSCRSCGIKDEKSLNKIIAKEKKMSSKIDKNV